MLDLLVGMDDHLDKYFIPYYWTTEKQAYAKILDTPDAKEIHIDLPGLKTEDLEVAVADDLLTIQAKDYKEIFKISDRFATANITAAYEAGVLKVRVPKTDEIKPRRIPITEK
jgi:HSP20 family molecular chaperone IbpA